MSNSRVCEKECLSGPRPKSTYSSQSLTSLYISGKTYKGFRRANWVIVILLRALVFSSYSITLPSMHQYVTNPALVEKTSTVVTQDSTDIVPEFTPGLGESEVVYTWAVVMYSIGELVGALVAEPCTWIIPYRFSFLLGIAMDPLGYIIYSMAVNGAMVLVAKFFVGMNAGLLLTFMTTYIAETAELHYQLQERLLEVKSEPISKESKLKDMLYACYSLTGTASCIIPPAISAVVSVFPMINPYRWTGWFITLASFISALVFLAVFREYKVFRFPTCSRKKTNYRSVRMDAGLACKIISRALGTDAVGKVPIFLFLYVCAYISGSGYALVDTLVNPIIADHFGFSVADSSFFMIGITALFFLSSLLFLGLKQMKIDSRKVFIFGLGTGILSCFLMADWQSIGKDYCSTEASLHDVHSPTAASDYHLEEINASISHSEQDDFLNLTKITFESDNFFGLTNRSTLHKYQMLARRCELQSTSKYRCFWNPKSRVTGKICFDCYQVCRSVGMSLHFVQFCLGITLFSLTVPLMNICITVILSNLTTVPLMGTVMGLTLATASLGRMALPFWSDAIYEQTHKHTLLPMTVVALRLAIVSVVFLALYEKLSPDSWLERSANDQAVREKTEMNAVKSGQAEESDIESGENDTRNGSVLDGWKPQEVSPLL